MRCFTHEDAEAVGVCRACGRGVCRSCAVPTEGALACRGRCEADVADLRRSIAPGVVAEAKAFRDESRGRSREMMALVARQTRIRAGAAFVVAACLTPIGVAEPASRRPFWLGAVAGFALVGWLGLRTARRYAALGRSDDAPTSSG